MAAGGSNAASIPQMGLDGGSFRSRVRVSSARRVITCCGLAAAVVCAVVALRRGGERAPAALEARDVNTFEDKPAFHAEWSQKELQHHFVNTQRVQTTANNKLDAGIQALDKKVEIIMHLLKHRPDGGAGTQGVTGKSGGQGARGSVGLVGEEGVPGRTGERGMEGVSGINGPAGASGSQGFVGGPGEQGQPGDQGSQGEEGLQGEKGQMGQKGARGNEGFEGPPGPQGYISPLQVHHYTSDGMKAAATPSLARAAYSRLKAKADAAKTAADPDSGLERRGAGGQVRGDIRLTERGVRGGYKLDVEGKRGDRLEVSIRGDDGFHASFKGAAGRVDTGRVQGGEGKSGDLVRVRDQSDGEDHFFKLRAARA